MNTIKVDVFESEGDSFTVSHRVWADPAHCEPYVTLTIDGVTFFLHDPATLIEIRSQCMGAYRSLREARVARVFDGPVGVE